MSDRILITGGFGYVGGRVAAFLAEDPAFLVRLATRRPNPQLPEWLPHGEVVSLDMASEDDLRHALDGVRHVVHLAAANEIESAQNPEKALIDTGLGTLRMLNAAIAAHVERFVFMSTAHVYGAPLEGVIDEQRLPRPLHPYAITHRTGEDFVLAAQAQGKIKGLVVRLSNGFGVPTHAAVDRWSLIFNDLCRQAVMTRQLVLKTSGLQRRDFIALADVARAVEHLLEMPAESCQDGLFNLGGECSMSMREVAQLVAERCEVVLGFKPLLVAPDPAPGEKGNDLDFRLDKLKATGYALSGDMRREVDALLRLCQQAFSPVSPA